MTLTDWRAWLYSAKAFLAGCLALYISLRLDFPRPYWALASVYIIAQPLVGATLSKAVYRLLGTALGAISVVVMVPALVNWPPLLSAAIACWTGGCLFLSLLDRRPHSYIFMLAGYSAAIIGLPSVDAPGDVFLAAIARVQEISVAIVCASLVSAVAWPQSINVVFVERINGWLLRAMAWSRDTLGTPEAALKPEPLRLQLASDAADIDILASHLGFDPAVPAKGRRWADMLRARMLLMLPLISAIQSRLDALQPHGLTPPVQAVVNDVRDWLGQGAPDHAAQPLRLKIASAAPAISPQTSWADLLRCNLMLRLRDLVDLCTDCATLRRSIEGAPGNPVMAMHDVDAARGSGARHADIGLALRSALSAALAIGLSCLFWIATGWSGGSSVPVMAAIACSFFSNLDNPVAPQLSFVKASIYSVVMAGFYSFAVLPRTDAFWPLVVVLAPAMLLSGAVAANPRTLTLGMLTATNLPTLLGLQQRYSSDLPSFADGGFALILGGIFATLTTALFRSFQPSYVVKRIYRANRLLLARTAEQRGHGDRGAFVSLLLDRVGQIVPRSSGHDAWWGLMREIRTGLNIIALRRSRHILPRTMVMALDQVLDELALEFRRRADQATVTTVPDLSSIDHALALATQLPPSRARDDTVVALIGIRLAFFPNPPDYAAHSLNIKSAMEPIT